MDILYRDVTKLKARLNVRTSLSEEDLVWEVGKMAELEREGLPEDPTEREAYFRAWIFHPDERVPAALLRTNLLESLEWEEGAKLEFELIEETLKRAVNSKEVWNPLLDAIAESHAWVESDFAHGFENENKVPEAYEYVSVQLRKWVEVQDVETIKSYLEVFRSEDAVEAAIGFMTLPAAEDFERLLKLHPRGLWRAAARDVLAESHIKILKKRIVEEVLATDTEADEALCAEDLLALPVPDRQPRRDGENRPGAVEAYGLLAGKGLFFDAGQVTELFEGLGEASAGPASSRTQNILSLLQEHLRLKPDVGRAKELLEWLFGAGQPDWAAEVLHAITASPEYEVYFETDFILWVLKKGGHVPQFAAVVANEDELRKQPLIRTELIKNSNLNASAATLLLADRREAEFRHLFRKLMSDVEANVSQVKGSERERIRLEAKVGAVLESYKETAERTLETEDIKGLFSFENRKVRVQAINLLGRIQERLGEIEKSREASRKIR